MLQTRSALPELGSGARALCGARCPRVAVPVPPALVACFICFRKCLWHGAALSGASGSPCAREGRPGGHRGRIGGPPSLGRVVLCHPPAGAVGTRVTCFSCGTRSAPTLLRPCSLLRAGSGGPVFPPKTSPRPLLALLQRLQQPWAIPARPRSRPWRRGFLRGLQVQGDGFGVGFFPPLNSIFSRRRGSRRRLLLRETSGSALVADAPIPEPWKTLLRPAPPAPRRREIIKSERKSRRNMEVWGCEVESDSGGMVPEALPSSGDAAGPGRVGWEQMEPGTFPRPGL